MWRFRTIPHAIRVLVALFLIGQFAGIVPSPLASTEAFASAVASHLDYHHAQLHNFQGSTAHRADHNADRPDRCCALHAFFAGVLPSPATVEIKALSGQRIVGDLADIGGGLIQGGLDRPPRSLL